MVIQREQPYGAHVKDLFEVQRYPEGKAPYDVAGWTLPILLGVDLDLSVIELRVEARFELQLTNHLSSDVKNPDDQRIHEGMLFAGVFF